MLRKAISTITLTAVLMAATSVADTLVIEGISSDQSPAHPLRGASKASVQSEWGEPRDRRGPVGEPPISRWDYDPFVVYFENDRVVHTVDKR
jgi:hypothetical protein